MPSSSWSAERSDRLRAYSAGFSDTGAIALLVLMSALVSWLYFAPALEMDDWISLVETAWSDNPWVDWAEPRSLLMAVLRAPGEVSGLRVPVMYALLWLINCVLIAGLYMICRRVFRLGVGLAFSAALLFSVFPADFTRTWLLTFGIRVALVLTLTSILLLAHESKKGRLRIPLLLIGAVCLLAALNIYELQFGVAAAWPLVAGLATREWRRYVTGAVVSLGVCVIAGLSRIAWQDEGPYEEMLTLDPVELVGRLWLGLKGLGAAWLVPLEALFGVSRMVALIGLAVVCGLAGLASWWAGSRLRRVPFSETGYLGSWRLAAAGLVMAVSGFFPIVLVQTPRISRYSSRWNILAIMGVSIAIIGVLLIATESLRVSRRLRPMVVLGTLLPAVILGAGVQVGFQQDKAASWDLQRRIWLAVLERVPDVEPETIIYLDVSEYSSRPGSPLNRHGIREPLQAPWAVNSAVRVLYDDSSLKGRLSRQLAVADVILVDSRKMREVPPGRLLVLRVTGSVPQAEIVRDLREIDTLATSPGLEQIQDRYHPELRLLGGGEVSELARRLVGAS